MPSRTILKSSSTKAVGLKHPLTRSHPSFVKVESHPLYFRVVRNAFKNMIGPIYGDQKKAIAKIKDGLDRACEVMLQYENPIGVIVYKNKLQNEYGLENALELKTLFLFNPDKNSGHGFGSKLFQRIDEVAQEKGARFIYCTASSKVTSSINCAVKNGYKIVRVLKESKEEILYLLIKEL